jgi:signal transduction histidine kinase/CheY-like chemotaxis protein
VRALDLIASVFGLGSNGDRPLVARDQLLDNIADPLFVLDSSRAVLDMNAAAIRLAGTPEHWRGANVDALFPFLKGAAIAGAGAATAFDLDTGDVAYDIRVSRVRANRGAWLVMLRDVTERRRIAAERERFVTRNSELVSRISHELRTPIAAIQGSLQLVLGTARTSLDDDALRLLESALRSTERLARVVHEILDITAIDAVRTAGGPQAVAVERLVIDALLDVAQMAADKPARIESAVEPNLPMVWGDPDRLVQVLVNLLANAIRFGPSGSTVTVTARREPRWIAIGVEDQGPGISKDRVNSVLQGHGMAVTKALVEQQGGRLAVESAPGAGATFFIYLRHAPASRAQAPRTSPAEEYEAEPLPPPQRSRILVADDDPDLRDIVTEALEANGFTVFAAADGQEALDVLSAEDVDLAVLDLQMPRRTGQEVIKEVRHGDRQPHLPVVVLTGSLDEREPHALGANVLLTKPTDLRRLVAEVRSLLERR